MKRINFFLTLTFSLFCCGNIEAVTEVSKLSDLQTALSGSSDTVALGADINVGVGSSAAQFTIKNTIVFDLKGHTLSGGGADTKPTFLFTSGASLSITSSNGIGTIDMSNNGNNGKLFDLVSGAYLYLNSAEVVYKKGYKWFNSTSGNRNVTAGSFNTNVASDMAIDKNNYECVSVDGLYVVRQLPVICTVDGVEYRNLATAITAAQNAGKPIILTSDVTYASAISANVTIDGATNNKKLTVNNTISNGTYNGELQANYIKGGTFYGKTQSMYSITAGTFEATCDLTVGSYISGGTFNTTATATTYISGGTFNAAATATTYISGGLFSQNPTGAIQEGYVKITNGSKYMVTSQTNVAEEKVVNGAFDKYYNISQFAENTTHTVLTANTTKDYVVLSNDVNGQGKLYKGVYNFSMSSVIIDGFSAYSFNGNSYIIGKDVVTDSGNNYRIIGGTFMFDPSPYIDTEVFDVSLSEGLYTITIKSGKGNITIDNQEFMTFAAAIAAVPTGVKKTITLKANMTERMTIAAGQDIVLDLNNKTINVSGHAITNNGKLTIIDNSNEKTGTIIATNSVVVCNSGSTTNILGGTLKGKGSYNNYGTLTANSGCKLYIQGGTIICDGGYYAVFCKNSSAEDVKMTGGTLTSTGSVTATIYVYSYYTAMTISGGRVEGNIKGKSSSSSKVKLTGGVYTTNVSSSSNCTIPTGYSADYDEIDQVYEVQEKYYDIVVGSCQHGSLTLSGVDGDYAKAGAKITITPTVEQNYKLTEIYTLDDNDNKEVIDYDESNEEYTFKATKNVTVNATIVEVIHNVQNVTKGNFYYETVEQAINDANAENEIRVLQNYNNANSEGWVNRGEVLTIDLNDKTINLTGNACVEIAGQMTVKNGTILSNYNYTLITNMYHPNDQSYEYSQLHLENLNLNGGINMLATDIILTDDTIDASNKEFYALYLTNDNLPSSAIIESGYYQGKSTAICAPNISGNKKNSVKIQGGKVVGNLNVGNQSTMVISGGEFTIAPANEYVVSDFEAKQDPITGNYVISKEGKRQSVTLNKIGTICLDYDVKAGDFEGAQFYQIAYRDDNMVYFDQVQELKAGYAYIFSPDKSGDITYKMSGAHANSPIDFNGLHGTFTAINPSHETTANMLTNQYIVSNNTIQKCGNGCWLNANRAYIVWDEIPTDATPQAPNRHRIALRNNDNNTTTELQTVQTNNHSCTKNLENGQIVIRRNGIKYNISGQVIR